MRSSNCETYADNNDVNKTAFQDKYREFVLKTKALFFVVKAPQT